MFLRASQPSCSRSTTVAPRVAGWRTPSEGDAMRILLTTEVFLPRISGLVTAVRNLAEALVDYGDQVWLACPASIEAQQWSRDVGVPLVPLRSVRLRGDLAIGIPSPRYLSAEGMDAFDVVHAHSPGFVGGVVIAASRRRRIPSVATLHTLPENLVGPFGLSVQSRRCADRTLSDLICRPFRHVDAAVAPTSYAAAILRRYVCKPPQVVSNGVRLPRGPRELWQRERGRGEPLRAVYIGRLQREKRVEELIDGLAVARALGTDARLTLVGSGPEAAKLRSRARQIGVAASVTFCGRLSASALQRTLEAASLFCIASRSELQCCAALEAMACGLPIVGARYGAISETAPDGQVGQLYASGDSRDLGKTLHELANDPANYKRYSAGAVAQAEAHSLEATARQLHELYLKAESQSQIGRSR